MTSLHDEVRNAIARRIRVVRQIGVIHATADWLGLIELLTDDVMREFEQALDVAELREQATALAARK